ncbi:Cof-type HAD-IIB family hydrolase [Ectobacillus polymachus]|uniref:Cof-type HAD-IIB family hydrolase n=1 Tax=Ectobacillus polymachus TaxID=1508806 RepID=UPI003A8B6856
MEKKIVFFDIDGTLLDSNKSLQESTKYAIHELQQKGVYTAIATGRTPTMFEPIREELNIESYVSINGQYVVFEGAEIYTNEIETMQLDKLVTDAELRGHEMAFYNHEYVYATAQNHPYIEDSFQSFHMNYPPHNRNFYKENPVYQGLLFCKETDEGYYEKSFPNFEFVRWHNLALDVLPKGSSKAKGIQQFINRAGFKRENTFAFGDGRNDMQMISYVGTGIVMGNAVDELKQCADIVTNSCDDDGIWNGLKAVGLL